MVGAFFPTPYPDELFYSILCRYFVRSGSISSSNTIIKLFGGLTALSTTLYYPIRLNCIEKWVPPNSGITYKTVIEKHSLHPYLLISEIYNTFFKEMPLSLIIERKVRIQMGKMKLLHEYLRFCPLCAEDDKTVYGETFWRRIHNIPYVVYCTVHKTRLIDSSLQLKAKQYTLFPASDAMELCKIALAKTPDNLLPYKEFFMVIAQESVWLLQNGLRLNKSGYIRRKYISFLKEKGINTAYDVIDKSISDHLNNYWGTGFLNSLFHEGHETSDNALIYSLRTRSIYNFLPIHHILVMCLLRGSVEKFI